MSDRPQFIEQQWRSFFAAVGLQDAPAIQLQEMRRAFFAGARAYSSIIFQHVETGDEPTDNDMALMAALEAEMVAFARDVAQGRA